MSSVIRFGTSGWRGIIAQEITFDNVRLAAQAVALYLNEELKSPQSEIHGRKPLVLLGYDARFAGREFCLAVAEVLEHNGLIPLMTDRNVPTPALAHSIGVKKAIAAINMTASHNPPMYQGLKLSLWHRAGAGKDVTQKIEATSDRLLKKKWSFQPSGTYTCKTFDPKPAFFRKIESIIDFDVIRKSKLKIAVELMYGTGRGYLDALLEKHGLTLTKFHDCENPYFGGKNPEPNAEGMEEVRECVLKRQAQLGLGLDGDADRFGIVDKDGTWLTPNQVLALALYHLKKNRGWTGSAIRTVPTSHQVDAIAELLGVKMHETPVGFKYIGSIMESEPVIVGGEESGGLSVKGHVPEKDGVLACLLMAELVATEKKSLGQILKRLEKKTGEFHTTRINVAIPADKMKGLTKKLSQGLEKIGSLKVQDFITTDGWKFLLPNGEWVGFRASGTEPVFRCYIEAKSAANLKKLITASKSLLKKLAQ